MHVSHDAVVRLARRLDLRQRRAEVAHEAFEESAELSRALDWREGIAMNVSQLRNFEDKAQNKRDREFF